MFECLELSRNTCVLHHIVKKVEPLLLFNRFVNRLMSGGDTYIKKTATFNR